MVYSIGIDTYLQLQQYLPLAVLKPWLYSDALYPTNIVATVPTACGIETRSYFRSLSTFFSSCNSTYRLRYWNVTTDCIALISPLWLQQHLPFTVLKLETCKIHLCTDSLVATVLTVYGIETVLYRLYYGRYDPWLLQQHLPFTVLKLTFIGMIYIYIYVCCNSTYHLRHMTKNSIIRWEYPTNTKKLYPRSPKVEFSSINLYNTMLIVSYICLVYN